MKIDLDKLVSKELFSIIGVGFLDCLIVIALSFVGSFVSWFLISGLYNWGCVVGPGVVIALMVGNFITMFLVIEYYTLLELSDEYYKLKARSKK